MSIQQFLLNKKTSPLDATLPLQVQGSPPPFFPGEGQTNAVTMEATGGTGNYTYNWEYVSGSVPGPMGINAGNNTTQKNMYWTLFMNFAPVNATATWRCTVSDGVDSVSRNIIVVFGIA